MRMFSKYFAVQVFFNLIRFFELHVLLYVPLLITCSCANLVVCSQSTISRKKTTYIRFVRERVYFEMTGAWKKKDVNNERSDEDNVKVSETSGKKKRKMGVRTR